MRRTYTALKDQDSDDEFGWDQGNLADLYESLFWLVAEWEARLIIVQYEMESEQIYCGPAAEFLSPYIA